MFSGNEHCPRRNCTQYLDIFGDHLLGCPYGVTLGNVPLIWRHDSLVRLLQSDLTVAKRRPLLERREPETRKSRPDLHCIGTSSTIDFIELSVTKPLAGSAHCLKSLATSPNQVLKRLEAEKRKQHGAILDKQTNADLVIVPLTTLGGWTKSARIYLKEVIKSSASRSMDKFEFAITTAYSRYAALMLSGNVHCLTEGLTSTSLEFDD